MGAVDRENMILPDGRRMAFQEFGKDNGRPVFYCHGFPASRLEAGLVATVAEKLNLRLIAPDRPGYGFSDPRPGHALADWADDLAFLADRSGCRRFGILGVSGGAPYALAAARRLFRRVEKVVLACPLGPLDDCGALREFPRPGRFFLSLAKSARPLLKGLVALVSLLVRIGRPDLVFRLLAAAPPPADRKVLENPRIRKQFEAIVTEAFRQGSAAVYDELIRYTAPWGFDPGEIRLPVDLWHGAADRTVPVGTGRFLAACLPDCRLRILPEEGHFSLPLDHAEEILRGFPADEDKSFS